MLRLTNEDRYISARAQVRQAGPGSMNLRAAILLAAYLVFYFSKQT